MNLDIPKQFVAEFIRMFEFRFAVIPAIYQTRIHRRGFRACWIDPQTVRDQRGQ
jgi:hypothetical protein